MGKIQVLNDDLANMIAAGEVVERPSSVIKELVENSIDAHSKQICVRIYEAGRKLISVEDDGDGMDRDDAIIAFQRHATSKIHSSFDLFRIKTLGFRGEALPSIASVSRLTLTTSNEIGVGTRIFIQGDKMQISDAPLRKGTIIEVEELFYNTPARLKYLKKDYTENANSIEVMTRLALAHPDIAFRFYIDDRLQFQSNGRGDLLETIAQIYGIEVAKKMLPFHYEQHDFRVHGFLGAPELAKSSRYYMITLLNGRNVYMPKVQAAIIDSYHDFIPPTRFPFVILCLDIDCALVDVNVHPSKKEVRFSKEEELRLALLENIPQALNKQQKLADAVISRSVLSQVSDFEDRSPIMETKAEQLHILHDSQIDPLSRRVDEDFSITDSSSDHLEEKKMPFREEEQKDTPPVYEAQKEPMHLRALAQMHKTYIIAEDNEGGFYLVDQHAAYERINYERFQRLLNQELRVHEPLIPQVIQLSPSDALLFNDQKRELLAEIGLRFESFGLQAWKVTQVPSWLNEADEKEYIDTIMEQALHGDKVDIQKLRTHVIATMSCKASIKANDYLDLKEMQYLLDTLFLCDNPTCCPHGRPTIIHFSKYQLEHLFKRTGV